MAKRTISPGGTIDGAVELPGDKSISHRYAILAALADGASEISNYASAADCHSTLECFRQLGIEIEIDKARVRIGGKGLHGLSKAARGARRGKFRFDDADAGGRAGRAAVCFHADWRRIPAPAADEARDRAVAADGRWKSKAGRVTARPSKFAAETCEESTTRRRLPARR